MAVTMIVNEDDPEYGNMAAAWTAQDRPRDFQFEGKHFQVFTEGMGFKFVQVSDPGSESYGSLSTNRLGR